ncbi:hypothetical protein KL925_002071 [Ogataea polymorpha]|nr:hypothetical protein KL936_002224 [Ogataea polymorpha]KAG7894087.1 hypothetical protein KL908_002364 [Ogataea polymorpha]KAG7927713.1 hypothetical protein KL925_002071 [Ogataea polymorpha]KAG7931588.1 hypothetical protein KL934_004000 [Ogataea polymorpha]
MPYTVLSPSGAVARDHLSNERTMLAYLRTSMSFLSLGVGVVRLAKYAIIDPLKPLNLEKYPEMLRHDYYIATTYARPLGALSLAAALLTLAFGITRYCIMFNRIVHSERFQNGAIPAFVKSQTPKVEKTEKPKKPKGRAYKRLLYTKRFVNVANTPGGKRRMNPGPSSK